MVTRVWVVILLHIIEGWRYIYERSRIVGLENPSQQILVKGPGYILDTLEKSYPPLEVLAKNIEEMDEVRKSVKWWITKLKKEYGDQSDDGSKLPVTLIREDAVELAEECGKWMNAISQYYRKPITALLDEEKLMNVIPNNLIEKLDNIAKEDLAEGVYVLAHGFPTASAMILFRAGESIIQKTYRNIIGSDPSEKTWGQMLKELEDTGKVRKSLLGYMYYLNEKRIDSAHPLRRYTQEESERILLHIKSLLEEL